MLTVPRQPLTGSARRSRLERGLVRLNLRLVPRLRLNLVLLQPGTMRSLPVMRRRVTLPVLLRLRLKLRRPKLKLRRLKLTQQALPLLPSLSKNLPGHTSITRLKKLKKLPTLPLRLRLLKLTLHRQLLLRLVLLLVLKLRRASLPLLLLRRLLLGMLLRPRKLTLLGLLLPLRPLRLTLSSLRLTPIITVQKLVTMPERRLQMLLVLHLLVTRLNHPSRQLRPLRLTRISIDR